MFYLDFGKIENFFAENFIKSQVTKWRFMYSNAKAQHLPKSTALLYNLSYQLVLQPTAPGHILQIFLWVTIQDQIGIAKRVIVDKVV